ncbi:MAG TPA: ATP-dependent Clp protease ATP-binding subunit, partial [Chloroflexota bacterium]|nr:ATP-dependent Clp protease ATP-binding subunit [Chloroflexota bacterium]
EKDAALSRRFLPVSVDEPSVSETVEILRGLRSTYETFHSVTISDEALEWAASMSERYLTDRALPDKAIDLIDEAASRVKVTRLTLPDDIRRRQRLREQAITEREHAVEWHQYERATTLAEEDRRLDAEIEALRLAWRERLAQNKSIISRDDIAKVVAGWTGVPVAALSESESQRLLGAEAALAERIVGQEPALRAISKALRRSAARLGDPNRPTASLLFVGPTGVGKTEVAKALAEYLFNDEDHLIRFDMSEFGEYHTISRLVGAPPGYVGYENAGDLTEAVRRRPYSVVLFDEIDKAHPQVLTALLQIMDSGHLTDAQGRRVNFKNAVILLTANFGTERLRHAGIGFLPDHAGMTGATVRRVVDAELKRRLAPEFLNRLDDTIVFEPLVPGDMAAIAERLLARERERAEAKGFGLRWSPEVVALLAKEGFTPHDGARPLRVLIQRHVEDEMTQQLLDGRLAPGQTIVVDVQDGVILISGEAPVASADSAADEAHVAEPVSA